MNKFFQFNKFFELGKVFKDCEAYLIALEHFDKALELSYLPINKNRLVKVYELRGNSNIWLGNYWKSISDFSCAIKIDSNNSFLYFWRAFAYEFLEEYPKAVNDLKIGLKLDSEFGLTKSLLDYLKEKYFE